MKEYLPDTSAIINGILSEEIKKGKIRGKVLIHKSVLAELESQANHGREVGFVGLDELKELRKLEDKGKIKVDFIGKRPKEFHIKYAKSGEIDALIRDAAYERGATFITLDKVDAEAAKALGLDVIFIEASKREEKTDKKKRKKFALKKYFKKNTMSVHLKGGVPPVAKVGKPGDWEFKKVGKRINSRKLEKITKELIEYAKRNKRSFVESEKKGSVILQIRNYRIVITKPPFADNWEITAVRPTKKLSLKDYDIPKSLKERFKYEAEGILISGAPGMGKSTFAQALANFYEKDNKIVKTIEAPRDLNLSRKTTQYSKALGEIDEIKDVLLLSRPDHTIYDEMRNDEDFELYSDMRLAGVGMIGVVHATSSIDSIQRFVSRMELGMIPSIIDTVVFIKNGQIEKVYGLQMSVKVPYKMTEKDLARPVVEIKNVLSGKVEYEMYSYGEQTAIVPVEEVDEGGIKETLQKELDMSFNMSVKDGTVNLRVPKNKIKNVIGKGGKRVKNLEEKIGMPIDVGPSN